ncbi:hypothetical protein DH2020_034203 [Rehmannia glutinosa]|uniref:Ribulose bisphosphate carboxylase small subunit n=1 Tax=Rehmannia glutinosa TaxID=99300 RepID=A0ABR0VD48_REHGL
MASSMISTAAIGSIHRASTRLRPHPAAFDLNGLAKAFPITRKNENDITSIASNGGRVQCMKVWPTVGLKKYEALSYLPTLSQESLAKEIEYLLREKWIPCFEFELEMFSTDRFVYRENHRSPGYYDGRYWTMWKLLPMFGCTDAVQVLQELARGGQEGMHSRIIRFDNVRQVQCISFIAYKPPGY